MNHQQVDGAERVLGFKLPSLLRLIYTELGNGGYGPGTTDNHACIIPLLTDPNQPDLSDLKSAVGIYLEYWLHAVDANVPEWDPNDPEWYWMEGLLPLCNWGGSEISLVHCTRPGAPVIMWCPDWDEWLFQQWFPKPSDAQKYYSGLQGRAFVQSPSLERWLNSWADDNIDELFPMLRKKKRK